ncbi:SEC-C metal-binding domain-containing protein [Lysobacter gummosus]|uniref:SEC-C metal-binding domain-containing protein n=1 Tax=Lysobacter gummosus TaxID=262324 RepID=UPI003628F10B
MAGRQRLDRRDLRPVRPPRQRRSAGRRPDRTGHADQLPRAPGNRRQPARDAGRPAPPPHRSADPARTAAPRRNARSQRAVPCGSGKKYKKCHGA